MEEINAIIEGKVTPKLAGLLDVFKNEKKVSLAVAESKLGNAITKLPGLNIKPVADSTTNDLFRAIREHLSDLVPGMTPENFREMSLGLAHSLSRHKVKFSPDKVDVMIVHAVSLLDELDKELNTYAMRVKEWYGWHFPELAKILPDNMSYARIILALGLRSNATEADLSEILPYEIEAAVKAAADISMGTEITDEDLENIKLLAEQVVRYSEYRKQLADYLDSRMRAIAPNVTELVGPLVGARLIAHAKSLLNLAKNPSSTIQILGAEKALFRALKTKHNTPKYGLIYHASLVGQASGQNKGKIARQLAAKLALGVRTDALQDWDDDVEEEVRASLGLQSRIKLEHSLRRLEGKPLSKSVNFGPNGASQPAKWDLKEARKYNVDADGLVSDELGHPDQKRPLIEEVEDTKMGNGDVRDDDEADQTIADLSAVTQDDVPAKSSRKQKKRKSDAAEQATAETPKVLSEADYERLARLAGMSTSKFTRRFEKGQILLKADGSLEILGKKEIKGVKAEVEGAHDTPVDAKGSKRKHGADDDANVSAKEEKPKKKRKRRSEADA